MRNVLLVVYIQTYFLIKKERVHSLYYHTFYDLTCRRPLPAPTLVAVLYQLLLNTHWNIQVQGRSCSCPIAPRKIEMATEETIPSIL